MLLILRNNLIVHSVRIRKQYCVTFVFKSWTRNFRLAISANVILLGVYCPKQMCYLFLSDFSWSSCYSCCECSHIDLSEKKNFAYHVDSEETCGFKGRGTFIRNDRKDQITCSPDGVSVLFSYTILHFKSWENLLRISFSAKIWKLCRRTSCNDVAHSRIIRSNRDKVIGNWSLEKFYEYQKNNSTFLFFRKRGTKDSQVFIRGACAKFIINKCTIASSW